MKDQVSKITEETKRLLIIAYSSGYEQGHHDTVESVYWCLGETHDSEAAEWLDTALHDGAFDREVSHD